MHFHFREGCQKLYIYIMIYITKSEAFLHTQIPLLHEQRSLSLFHTVEEWPYCCILLIPTPREGNHRAVVWLSHFGLPSLLFSYFFLLGNKIA